MISIAMIANNLDVNGISTVIMNYCSNIDLERFHIKILAGKKVASVYRKKCEELGITVIELPYRKKEKVAYYRMLDKELSKEHFDIVHVHGNQAAIAVELFLAYKNKIRGRIAHCHNTTCANKIVHVLLKPAFHLLYTNGAACGKEAGYWLFGKKAFCVIPNGFYTEKFRFDNTKRMHIRKKLGLTNKEVLGHVGGINMQKNQEYLLQVFEKYALHHPNAVLLLVGDGPDYNMINDLVEKSIFRKRIILYGETEVPEQMYLAMDIFIFPSKYEGLPIALLEAQVSGLPCVVSDAITQEAIFSKNVTKLSLTETPEKWAETIARAERGGRESFYENHLQEIRNYNIYENVKVLEKLYEESFLDGKLL